MRKISPYKWHSVRDNPPTEIGFYEVKTKNTVVDETVYSKRLRYWDGKEWFLVLKDELQPAAEKSIALNEKPLNHFYRRPLKNKA
jgi:hypothetical protein